jgi:myo-inositol 2-dehydrogenase/D-chiro-inositol 1-dehydrogenase
VVAGSCSSASCRRYDHAHRAVKAAITNGTNGTIGEPLLGHAVHRNPQVPEDFRSDMVPYDVIVHEFDQFRWLFDQEIVSTTAVKVRSTPLAGPGLSDPQILPLELANGVVVDIEAYSTASTATTSGARSSAHSERSAWRTRPSPRSPLTVSAATQYPPTANPFRRPLPRRVAGVDHQFGSRYARSPSAWDGYAAISVAKSAVASSANGVRTPGGLVDKPSFYK